MMRILNQRVRRFLRSERGNSTIEFAITFPVMFMMLASAVELGFMSLRHSMLEHAMDEVVRDIRLGTGDAPQHDEIKDQICVAAGYLNDCSDNLRLEMILLDPTDWVTPSSDVDCTDQSEEVTPVRSFTNGLDNELMLLRACVKVNPVFATWGMGANMVKDNAGQYALVSSTAFVQEPG